MYVRCTRIIFSPSWHDVPFCPLAWNRVSPLELFIIFILRFIHGRTVDKQTEIHLRYTVEDMFARRIEDASQLVVSSCL